MRVRLSPADLIGLLGMEKALALCQAWGGKQIPTFVTALREVRQRKVLADLRRGYSPTEVALKYQLSLTTIYVQVAKLKKEREALARAGVSPETGPNIKEVSDG